ncbi:Breast cancer 2, early onset [Phytophthora pseudosyringae]|uniref:Breast cancer 2, early onset n=1 Tax=Phytophthora pseudosyringae TaxID=221518 RepID=A0A8T1WDH1_9STRA|nr:Breast cancer 2, early onset [Phytophthora pseudosyringae]
MLDDRASFSWRTAFDELLVFEQDFDTAMQILMFQDEKVARLALEDPQETRSQRARRAQTRRGGARSPSRKRRRTEASQAERAEPPSPPLSRFTQSSDLWSQSPFQDAQTQDVSPSSCLEATTLTQLSGMSISYHTDHLQMIRSEKVSSLAIPETSRAASGSRQHHQVYEAKRGTKEKNVASSTNTSATGTTAGSGAATVPSLFTTGSGKQVSVSASRLRAYEEKLRSEEESVASSTGASATGTTAGTTAGSGAATVPSLFTTGSGKQVSVSASRLRAGAATVPSLFTTGSGKQVSVSASRLRAYEEKLRSEEESVASSTGASATGTTAGTTAGSGAATVPSLFTTGSGKQVSVSASRLRAYEEKECEASFSDAVGASRIILRCGGIDMKKGGDVDAYTSRRLENSGLPSINMSGVLGDSGGKIAQTAVLNERALSGDEHERSFPRLLLEKYLTKDQLLKQMTHRYQRDLNDAQRSILKKILQRDASSLSCMVLCIGAVLPFPTGTSSAVDQELPASWNMALVLTDGWYSVYAVPDAPLAALLWKLHAKSNLVGTKLATWNASLQNSTEGVDPLECAIVCESQWKNPLLAKEDLTQWPYLQLRYNSTRRVRFDTRLGVEKLHFVAPTNSRHRKQQPQLTFSLLKSVPLKSLDVGGGMVRSVRVRVTRVSPILHLQSKEWTLGPRILCEEQLPLYFQLRSEYGRVVLEKQQDGTGSRADDSFGDDHIDVPLPIPFIKVDVECTHPSTNEHQGVGCGILTIWRPSEELLSGGLREGAQYFATSLTVNWKLDGGRGQDALMRLSSTKHSGFEEVYDNVSMADNETENIVLQPRSQRVCVDVKQATMDYRSNFEDGLNGRRNERRPTIDVCVCVVLVAARDTQDERSSSAKRQSEVSLLDPEIKPKESRYVEHVFVTDQSYHLMSIRVSGMEVSMPKKKSNSPLKRASSSSSSFVFRRGSKSIWKEGAILCLSGLEVSHYDEQLRVLDCVLVESTQIVSFPSKKSPFWDHFQLLQRETGISMTRGSASQVSPPSTNFELSQLKKYVERDILQMDFVPSQECNENHDMLHVEVVEQERLTQDLQAHEEGGEGATTDDESAKTRHLRWDANVVKVLPLVGANKFMFPRDVVAFACVKMGADDKAFRTVYLTREVMLSMQGLLREAGAPSQLCQQEDGATVTNAAFVQSVTEMLGKVKQQSADYSFRFEVCQSTNERLINSWRPWERLHASYWMAVTVAASPTAT